MPRVDITKINLFDLLLCMTNASDLISRELTYHHQQVAYLAFRIGEELGLSSEQQKTLMIAGLIHDMGSLSLEERLTLIEEETPSANDHAFRGARLFEGFPPFVAAANVIRFHHIPWNSGAGSQFDGQDISILSHIIHLADRICVSIKRDEDIIGQISSIRNKITFQSGTAFHPKLIDAFIKLSINEFIWLDLVYDPLLNFLPDMLLFDTVELNLDEIIGLTRIFSKIIDYRNPFTANHSAGVAKTSEKLAELLGLSENECKMMLVAGYLHDLGKLAVSHEILYKPGRLNPSEINVIKSHTFYTFRLLQAIKGFETINKWASFHHEKLSGKGYPFHLTSDALPLGSRIMAVSDIFTAITEDRPYRAGMEAGRVPEVLKSMVADNSLCPYVVSVLIENLDLLNETRRAAQAESAAAYSEIM